MRYPSTTRRPARQQLIFSELFGTPGVYFLGAVVNEDATWISETLAGNSSAFGQLVTKYQDRLYNTLVHVVGAEDDARDVVQDALVQAFVKLDTFQGNAAFYTWLYRIAFNVAISRKRKRRVTLSVDQARELAGEEPPARDESPTANLERQERIQQVRAALAAVSEEHRTILVLREIDGCCYETIADILEIPVGTVRSRLFRARMELREQLNAALHEDAH